MIQKVFTEEAVDASNYIDFIIHFQKHQDYGVALYEIDGEVWGFNAMSDYENGLEITDYTGMKYVLKPVTTLTYVLDKEPT